MRPWRRFRDLPIRRKLNAIILVTCASVLFVAAGSFVLYEAYRFRTDLLNQYTTLGGVLAANSAAAIVFRDARTGADTLTALRSDPHVVSASLTSGDGSLFAEYLREERSAAEKDRWAKEQGYDSWGAYQRFHHAAAEPYHFHRDRLDLFTPVVLDGETIGKLFVQVDLERLYGSLLGYALIVAGVLLASLFLAMLLSQNLQRVISEPILLLAERMGHVSKRRDYSIRVEKRSDDEIGAVFDGFNDMLSQIEQRDRELTRLAAALEQAPDGIAILDFEGRIHHANRAFLHLTRSTPEQVLRLSSARLYPPSLGTRSWQGVLAAARQGTPWTGRVRALRVDGSEYDEFCSVAPILDEQGQAVNALLLKRDITRELQMEERVRESQKLQALGTLAGGIAHDFNNLMSPIVAYSELLMARSEPGTKTHTRLERITSAALEASALVKQILAFSRPGSQSRQPMAVQSLVKECVKLFHMALPPNVVVECEADTDLPAVRADPSQLHQVLMNLLTNAKHAMKERGGRLLCRVDACTPTRDDVPEFPAVAGNPCVSIIVQDEGHGMSEDVRERIFEPFFSTKGLGEGTGMGLAVVRGIVEDHGGAISVESEPGRGTTFRVYLPVAGQEEVGVSPEEAADLVVGSERILLVEEDESVCEPLCEAIAMLGYRVDGVINGEQALERLAAPGARYDALVVDEQHLGGNGDGLLAGVRRLDPELAILVCGGCREDDLPEAFRQAGPIAVVPKPISPIAIGAVLRGIYPDGDEAV
jgi:PAS domain S-box-containing protein